MYCEVFRYFFEGNELPTKEAVKYTRALGELVYTERIYDPRPGRSLMLAMLLADDRERYLIPALGRARITRVRGGLFIEGIEINPRGRGSARRRPTRRCNSTFSSHPLTIHNMPTRPRIYLAGPDVFRRDAAQHFAALKAACARLDLEPLPPSDGLVPVWLPEAEMPQRIYDINMGLLQQADGVIANLAPFRGVEPDSGTVFEVGVAVARGVPVVAYGIPPGSYADRVMAGMRTSRGDDGALRDADGLVVEDLGLPLNLMLACSIRIEHTAADALRTLAGMLKPQT